MLTGRDKENKSSVLRQWKIGVKMGNITCYILHDEKRKMGNYCLLTFPLFNFSYPKLDGESSRWQRQESPGDNALLLSWHLFQKSTDYLWRWLPFFIDYLGNASNESNQRPNFQLAKRQRHFKLPKLNSTILVFIFGYAVSVKNMNKKSKIKAGFVGLIFNSDYEIRIANNIDSAHHHKRSWDQVKNRLYIS